MLFKIQWQKAVTYETLIEVDHKDLEIDPQYDLAQVPASLLLEFGNKVGEIVVADEFFVHEFQKIKEDGGW